MRAGTPTDRERGSAVAEFVLITALLLVLSMGLIQLTVYLHVRNVAADAASNAVRVAALADGTAGDGAERARELAAQALGSDAVLGVGTRESPTADGTVVTLTLRVRVPLLGVLPGPTSHEAVAVATRFL